MDNNFDAMAGELAKQLEGVEERLTATLTAALDAAKADLRHQATLNMEELKSHVTMVAEGYGGTLEGIERELVALNRKVDTKFGDHAAVLADHNRRITILEN